MAYLMSAALTVCLSGGLYLMPDLILIVSVLPPFEICGGPLREFWSRDVVLGLPAVQPALCGLPKLL
jgi:hypothetical protein